MTGEGFRLLSVSNAEHLGASSGNNHNQAVRVTVREQFEGIPHSGSYSPTFTHTLDTKSAQSQAINANLAKPRP